MNKQSVSDKPVALEAAVADCAAKARKGSLEIVDLFDICHRLTEAGRTQDAIAMYRDWLDHTKSPVAFAVRFNLGVSLSGAGDEAGAEQQYRRALEQKADFSEARMNLGTLLERTKRTDEALDTWRVVLTYARPDVPTERSFLVQALNNLGRLLENLKRFEEAEEMLRRSLLLEADQPNVITHYVHLRQKQCRWPIFEPFGDVTSEALMASTSALAMLSVSNDPAVQLEAASKFVKEKVVAGVPPLANMDGYRHERLRVGYLSSDLHSHAVAILTAELYELHDRSKVEVYAFSWTTEDGSPLRARVKAAMDHYIPIGHLGDREAAELIRSHEIDILVDLHGLTLGTRPNILAYKPAPVQVTYLGFPGPIGMPSIDYVIADEFLVPPELAAFFVEKPIYMPRCFQVNDRQRAIGPLPSRAECGLPDDKFVFCSFNNNFKFTEEMFDSWMRILTRVPESILWLVADHDIVRNNLRKAAADRGIDPGRLYFAERAYPAQYLARFQQADLFLDTFPFNAGTTASDALWAGLPLLTYTGKVFAARMAGSLLRAVDLPELITYSLQDYEDKAVALAHDPERIAAMKRQLHENRMTCALFDTPQFVRDLEERLERVARGERTGPAANTVQLTAEPVAPQLALPEAPPAPAPVVPPAPVPTPLSAKWPLVSIVIPAYKPAHFEQALKSAIGQTYPNVEILVSDNCPTEEIRDICAKYPQVLYQRSSVIRIDNVIGALFGAKGVFIKPLFDDDILHPFCVERMAATLLGRPDVEMVFSASQVINVDNQMTEERRPYPASGTVTGAQMQRAMAMRLCNFVGEFSTIMFRRAKLWALGPKDMFRIGSHDFSRGLADVAFYCNAARNASVFYIDEELSYFRHDERLMSNSNAQSNPDFGYCFSDYIDLAVVSHETGVISTEEMFMLRPLVDDTVSRLAPIFHQVVTSYQRYAAYMAGLEQAASATAQAALPAEAGA